MPLAGDCKSETVSGNAARLGRSVHLCLCKTPGQDRLAALLLLVLSGNEISDLAGYRWERESACRELVLARTGGGSGRPVTSASSLD